MRQQHPLRALLIVAVLAGSAAATPNITTRSLPPATLGIAYNRTVAVSGAEIPVIWSITAGSLPPGLALGPDDGTISGTPSAAGIHGFTVHVVDNAGASDSQPLAITVNVPRLTITTTALPDATFGVPYSQTLSATGGSPDYRWVHTGGSLPSGLSLSTSGVISGTPLGAGRSSFTVTVFDSTLRTDSQSLSITVVVPPLVVTTESLPNGAVGLAYSQTLAASGGSGGYSWSRAAGALPAGLSLTSSGIIAGTPATAGSSNFRVRVTDSGGRTADKALSITIDPAAPTITTASLPGGQVGAPYSQTLAATGGSGGYSWSVASGTLPTGLSLSPSGTIAGTPTAAGSWDFTVAVADSGGRSSNRALSIAIQPATLAVATSALANGTVGVEYSQTLTATGGSGGYTWTLAGGSLPAGLTLSSEGAFLGTPMAAGTANFSVRVVDSGGRIASKAFAIQIDPSLTVATPSLPAGTVGVAYSQTLSQTGGIGDITWSLAGGALPTGLALSPAGAISGTPTAAGTSNFTVRVADGAKRSASKDLSIVIFSALTITTASLPSGTADVAYSQTLAAAGGSGGNSWSLTGGSLPAGLTLSAAGVIAGTPTTAGASNFTVQVTDNGGRTASKDLSIAIVAPLTVSTASLPGGTIGVGYSQTLEAAGGSGGNSWSLAGGALPAGLVLSPAGAITGTPTAAGTSNFTVKVADNGGRSASKELSIVVVPALTVSTSSLPGGTTGAGYSQTLEATGGSGGNSWSLAGGALPAGLALSPGGTILGTPTAAGTSNFTVKVTDNGGRTASKDLAIVVVQALTISTATLRAGTLGAAYTQTLEATGGSGGNSWNVAGGTLPDGLGLSAAGAISGTPTVVGTSNFTVKVADSGGQTASKDFSILIVSALTVTTASLPGGTIGINYSQTLEAAGGGGGNSWSLADGALPAGLALSPAGAITGTPTAAGTSNFNVKVADSAGRTASKDLSIVVLPALSVATTSLPSGTVGVGYSQTLAAAGGSGGNEWVISAGALPTGIALSVAGAIMGTPTAAGSYDFTVTVTDRAKATASKALTIAINPPALTVSTASVPPSVVGAQYSFTLSATGGSGGNAWAITSGVLPAGLSLSSAGTIAGRPTTAGTSNFTVQVKDSAGATASKALSMTVTPSTLVITTQSLPAATQGAAYSQPLTATGGAGAYRWSLEAGTLPDGLTLDPAGRIVGTPTAGSATFTIAVADGSGVTANRTLSIAVTPPLSLPSSETLPNGVTGTAYSGSIKPTGGQSPYTFAVASGQMPPGLTLDSRSGAITGRPTQVGSFTFAVQVRDAANTQIQASYTIAIANTLTVINPPVLPAGSIGVAYQVTLTAAGGTTPYSWSATAGSLPAGLTFRPDGVIDGTPTAAGTFTFTATVTDALGAKASKEFTLTVAATLTITTGPQLPQGVPAAPYNTTLAASGGTPPYVWSIASGSLPDGLRLEPATGAITGIPSAPITANFTATVADSRNVTAQKAFTLTIAPGVTFTTPAILPSAVAGEAYTFTLTATGGRPPYSWRISNGELPAGLSLTAASGVIAGTPSAAGTFNFTIEVADSSGLKTTRVHTLVVDLPSVATLRVSGVPETLGPMQQPQVDLVIVNPYPVAITGRLNVAFVPAAGMPDDPAVQFSSGGRSATFTIAANDTRASFSVPRLLIQSGSVAGTIQFTVESLRAGNSTLPAPNGPVGAAQIPASAAIVRAVEVRRTTGGFDLLVTGASTTRELTRAVVRFRPPAGATLQTTELAIDLADAARGWFQSAASAPYGGLFSLTVPFSFVGGPSAIEAVTVALTNSAGDSQELSAPY